MQLVQLSIIVLFLSSCAMSNTQKILQDGKRNDKSRVIFSSETKRGLTINN